MALTDNLSDTLPSTSDAHAAAARACEHLLSLQDEAGWWKGELETNVTMDAEDLLLREFLGIRSEEDTVQAARWIRSQQRADGTWANFYGGPADLSTTVEAYVALRLAGDEPGDARLVQAREYILAHGGIERTRVFTRIWLALFGLWRWEDLPVMPPELVFLPSWAPLNVYDWGCWARQTVVPLTIVSAVRPCRPMGLRFDELRTGAPPLPAQRWSTLPGFFQRLDRALHLYERRPLRSVRQQAIARAAEWIIARQEADGSWGGIQPPWVYSLIALHLVGYPLNHPVMRAGLDGLERFVVREQTPAGMVRRLEACQSPVWDTGLAMTALADAGIEPGHPALARAARWLLDEEVRIKGDWAVRRPDVPAGGWAFEFDNDFYPDTDDTAEVMLALRRVASGAPAVTSAVSMASAVSTVSAGASAEPTAVAPRLAAGIDAAVGRATTWVLGMQSRDGGWAAFDADNTREFARKLPFCDFGEVIDPPSADVTAHVVEALAHEGLTGSPALRRGVRWLRDAQEPDGSWFGRWGANYIYGTGAAVPALISADVPVGDPAIRRAVRWLEARQNADGGWGEDMRSYDNPAEAGRGASTASQTAWALLALLAAGERSPAVERGVAWLVDTQLANGTWDEPYFTGTGFPGDFYINYHLYRLVFPLSALGRYLGGSP